MKELMKDALICYWTNQLHHDYGQIAIADEVVTTCRIAQSRSVFLHLPLAAKHIQDDGQQKKQPPKVKRGAKRVILHTSTCK